MGGRLVFVACLLAGCGVRAPARLDVDGLVRTHGAIEARRELALRLVTDPRNVAARLALAKLAEQQGRPSEALEQLEAVHALGGPIGTRWHAEDRARLGRLLVARGRARIARGAPTALADLERARGLGARIPEMDLAAARQARAVVELSHVDAEERARGKTRLRALATAPGAEPAWRGARATATAAERGAFGRWLWSVGARRAAWDELAAWNAASSSLRDEALHGAYLVARAWWMPVDAPPPPPAELIGPARCRFAAAACSAIDADAATASALTFAPPVPTSDPEEALGWLVITLRAALRGDGAWGPSFASRVELSALPTERFPAVARGTFARLAGRDVVDDAPGSALAPGIQLVVAAGVALRGGTVDEVRGALGPLAATPEGSALLQVVAPAPAELVVAPVLEATLRFAEIHAIAGAADPASRIPRARVRAVLDGYARDPAIADRVGRDLVAEATDAAVGHATLGALYDALADPARARAAWQEAADASPEPRFVRGLALAIARAHDPDAALVIGTQAAAAWGDPAPVWIEIARALEGNGEHVHALEAARYAIDLASGETLGDALDVAIAASAALGRADQAVGLRTRRARVAPPPPDLERPGDRTDPRSAIAAARAGSASATQDVLWTASRWNPGDVSIRAALLEALAPEDARRRMLEAELVRLAGDRDVERARAALRALSSRRR